MIVSTPWETVGAGSGLGKLEVGLHHLVFPTGGRGELWKLYSGEYQGER